MGDSFDRLPRSNTHGSSHGRASHFSHPAQGMIVCVVYLVSVTLDRSHPSIGWLNELAPLSMALEEVGGEERGVVR